MAVDHIRYDLLTQEALRDVIRKVLSDAAKNGLPGDHHFFIAFDTRASGVRLSAAMRAQYPEEMTIILQHQFWDLSVNDDALEVGLSFSGVAERLRVPFAAIKSFFDPSVQFGLQFQVVDEAAADPAPAGKPTSDAEVTPLMARPESALRTIGSKTAKAKSTAGKSIASKSGDAKSADIKSADATSADSKSANTQSAKTESDETEARTDTPDEPPRKPEGGGEVVRLDRFRKK